MPDLYCGGFHLRKGAPVTGGSGQRTYRAVREDVVVVAADVLDLVDVAVVAPDPVPGLGDVLGAVRGDGNNAAVLEDGLLPDVDAIGGSVIGDIEAHSLANVPELHIVISVDGVCLQLRLFAVHIEPLGAGGGGELLYCRIGGGHQRGPDDNASHKLNVFPFHF